MLFGTLALFVCCGFLSTGLTYGQTCGGVAGQWKNELQSTMNLTCTPDSGSTTRGTLGGLYKSAVGRANGEYVISGRYTVIGLTNVTLGWTVAFNNDLGNMEATTSWTGSYNMTEGVIRTLWLLTSFEPDYNDLWQNTNIGHDEFTKASLVISNRT